MQLRILYVCQAPGLWKADIDAAFRRVPLQESHQWAAVVAYLYHGEPWVAVHRSMPFGATASVVAWHKVGALLQDLARHYCTCQYSVMWTIISLLRGLARFACLRLCLVLQLCTFS